MKSSDASFFSHQQQRLKTRSEELPCQINEKPPNHISVYNNKYVYHWDIDHQKSSHLRLKSSSNVQHSFFQQNIEKKIQSK